MGVLRVKVAGQWVDVAASAIVPGRNKADNGAMNIAQRGLTALTGVATDSGQRFVDRHAFRNSALGAMTYQTQVDGPPNTGIMQCFEVVVTTADGAPAAGDYGIFAHALEGLNVQDFLWGTSNALPITVSWYQKTNYLGPFIAEIFRNDAAQRSIAAVVSANTTSGVWQRRSVTFPGDVTGVITNDSAARVIFNLFCGAGSTYTGGSSLQNTWAATVNNQRAFGVGNLAATLNNYLRITGLQIEIGANASPFEMRHFADDLARCQRYAFYPGYNVPTGNYVHCGAGQGVSTASTVMTHQFPVTMRAIPTLDMNFTAFANYSCHDRVGAAGACTNITADVNMTPTTGAVTTANTAASMVANRPYHLLKNSGQVGCLGWSADI
jgi:hypothetical protein